MVCGGGRVAPSILPLWNFKIIHDFIGGGYMTSRNGNYVAFYVAEPFNASPLSAHATKDFCYYNMLRAWKGSDASFPFNDSHEKTYNVRDSSDWDATLKPRLRERIRNSKNIVLFLSSNTVSSKALREEIDYGINDQGLPVIVIYPEYDSKESLLIDGSLRRSVKKLWENIPIFKNSMNVVPTLHIPLKKSLIQSALNDENFMLSTKTASKIFRYVI